MNQVIFHLAFPVTDISKTKAFYVDGLGCKVGRQNNNSVILNLMGNQIVAHVTKELLKPQGGIYPRHFGLIFTAEADWEALLKQAQEKNLSFYQEPKRRFVGLPTEHRTFFLEDPFYNILEFKYYCHHDAIFGCSDIDLVGDAL
mgnify:CR=1 FL=1|jgi:uncharacterized protein